MNAQQLKNSILQLAVQGKLVPNEKVTQQKLKITPQNPIADDEIPFDIPDSWQWVRLGEICEQISAGGDKPKDFTVEQTRLCSIPVIANDETNNGIIGYTERSKNK